MIEQLITRLVQEAPVLDADVVAALRGELARHGTPLALAISRVVELVHEGLVRAGIALPELADACATLVASRDPRVLEAARFRVDTLVPVPDPPGGRGAVTVVDVPLSRVRRPRT